jgi:hypothetical protein
LQKGEIDMFHIRAKETLAALKKDPNVSLYMGPSGVPKAFITLNTESQYFKGVRVRRAMLYALDGDLITESVGGEMATRACGLLAPGVYEAAIGCDVLTKYPYDPAKAKALLAEAGFPNGFKSKLTILAVVPYVDIAPVLQDYWRKVGIDMEIEAVPVNDYLKKMNDGAQVTAMIWSVPRDLPRAVFSVDRSAFRIDQARHQHHAVQGDRQPAGQGDGLERPGRAEGALRADPEKVADELPHRSCVFRACRPGHAQGSRHGCQRQGPDADPFALAVGRQSSSTSSGDRGDCCRTPEALVSVRVSARGNPGFRDDGLGAATIQKDRRRFRVRNWRRRERFAEAAGCGNALRHRLSYYMPKYCWVVCSNCRSRC